MKVSKKILDSGIEKGTYNVLDLEFLVFYVSRNITNKFLIRHNESGAGGVLTINYGNFSDVEHCEIVAFIQRNNLMS